MKSLFKENPLKKTLLVKHITPLSNGEGKAAIGGWGRGFTYYSPYNT